MPRLVRRLALVLIATASACSRNSPPAAFNLRIGAVGALAPLTAEQPEGYAAVLHALVFEPLVSPRRTGPWISTFVSGLEQPTASPFRFRLKGRRTFGDGTPVETEDIERALAQRTTISEAGGWVHVTAGSAGVLLDAVVARDSPSGPLGAGPFVVTHQDETRITLKRRQPEAHHVEELELVSYKSPRDVFSATLRGEVNLLLMPSDGQVELLDGVGKLRVLRSPGPQSVVALFNAARIRPDERHSLALRLPATEIAAAYGPSCRPRPAAPEPRGVIPSRRLEIIRAEAFQGLGPMGLALRRGLGPIGGQLLTLPINEAYRRITTGDFDLALITSQTWPEELALSRWVTGAPENWGRYSNPEFDAAFAAGDFARAKAALEADPPALFICDLERTAAVDARLFDARLGDYDALELLPTWKVAPPP